MTDKLNIDKLYKFFSLLLLFFLLASCGKKGAPTLKSYEKPDAPSQLRAIHREDKITLYWDFPESKEDSIAEFILFKSSDKGFEKLTHIEKNKRSYILDSFVEGHKYTYKIISQNQKGIYSDDSNILTFTPSKAPDAPENLSFTISGDSLLIRWNNTRTGIFYNIYKSYEKGVYSLIPLNHVPLKENHFRDAFNPGKKVFYTIRSLLNTSIKDEGTASEELIVDPFSFIPSKPRGLNYLATDECVFLSWNESDEPWVKGFRIYKKTIGQDYVLIGETQIPAFIDKEKPLTKRSYRITAVGPEKEGPYAELTGVVYASGQ